MDTLSSERPTAKLPPTHKLVIGDLELAGTATAYLAQVLLERRRRHANSGCALALGVTTFEATAEARSAGDRLERAGEVSRESSHANAPPPSQRDGCE